MIDTQLVLDYYGHQNGVDIDFRNDVIVVNYCDGRDPQIEQWNIADKLRQPTWDEIYALEPEAMLYYARQNKLAELERKFNYMLENGHTTSSFGVEIDANVTSVRNVAGLLVVMGADDKEWFCDYNNQLHELTRQQVETIQVEIITYIQGLYDQKWVYRNQINTLTTAEEVNNIVIEFK